jgi:hypothetical protein
MSAVIQDRYACYMSLCRYGPAYLPAIRDASARHAPT